MSKVIITGAGGFVGSALTQKMVNNGIEVVAISQYYNSTFPNNPLIKKIETEIIDQDELIDMIPENQYDAFYHLAWRGINGVEKSDLFIQLNNIKISLLCASVASRLKCKKFLCSGTVAERAVESLSSIDMISGGMAYSTAKQCTHLIIETYCKNIGLNFVWMQFSNIYGPQNKTGNLVSYTLEQLRAGRNAIFGPAMQPYDFIFVDDIIEAIYRLGLKDTKHNYYFIGSGKPRILKDYLNEIGAEYGKPELIKIGVRPDDKIRYKMEMFDISNLVSDIGEYITASFEEHIKYTIHNY